MGFDFTQEKGATDGSRLRKLYDLFTVIDGHLCVPYGFEVPYDDPPRWPAELHGMKLVKVSKISLPMALTGPPR
jgi:hypothetical protein